MGFILDIKDKFSKNLPADPITENYRRTVENACFSYVVPKKPGKPSLIHASPEMARNIGLAKALGTQKFLDIFSGTEILPNSNPYAMCYGGHQFGNWAGQLGDGRAINLCEVEHRGKNWALQLKGAGSTPYSRSADGLAVLRSSIREYLCSEAMYHLGIPTTRALSLALSGDEVLRDVLYDGHPAYEKGAIVCRAAESFIRFGSFEILAARRDVKTLKQLADFVLTNHFPHLGAPSSKTYVRFFKEVAQKSLKMVLDWQRVGFVHGVMNTDNMSILGLTIDYGPYGWLEGYDPEWTPNTTDNAHKRYAYGRQPQMVLWNLFQLANALYPLVLEAEPLEEILREYKEAFAVGKLHMLRKKIGLVHNESKDVALLDKLDALLQKSETDMTIFFRDLGNFKKDMGAHGLEVVKNAFYQPHEIMGTIEAAWKEWFTAYGHRLNEESEGDRERKRSMAQVNPKYVLRNYMAQLAIDGADDGDYATLNELFELLKKPYDEQPGKEKWFAKRPEWARHKVGCSMLSCSS